VGQTGGNVDVDIANSITIDTDIVAQTVGNIAVAVNSAPTIDVDITAQTGANVDVDIESSVTLNTDIVAQTIGNLNVDIAASTIGNIPINISEQGVGDINIDLNAQTIGRVVIRDNDGGVESSSVSGTSCAANSETTMHTYNGSGSLRYVVFFAGAANDSHLLTPRIYVDGTRLLPEMSFYDLDNYGFDTNTRPWQLLKHVADDVCRSLFYVEKGLIFDTSLSFRFYNSADNAVNGTVYWFYQAL